ncbi:MAG: putative Ig domain-containing protein [Nitrospinae bacterium]|nr:putative Ig domain-containing protein [Nitrospinota bacterium]
MASNGTTTLLGSLPNGITFSSSHGALAGSFSAGSLYQITLTATNKYGSVSTTFIIKVAG